MRERERENAQRGSPVIDDEPTTAPASQEQRVRQIKCCGFSIIWEIAHNSFGFASQEPGLFFSNMHC